MKYNLDGSEVFLKACLVYQPSCSSFLPHPQLNLVSRNVSISFIARLDDSLRELWLRSFSWHGNGFTQPVWLAKFWEWCRWFSLTPTVLSSVVQLLTSVLLHNGTLMYKHKTIVKDLDLKFNPRLSVGPRQHFLMNSWRLPSLAAGDVSLLMLGGHQRGQAS